jgi:hypothetical protein
MKTTKLRQTINNKHCIFCHEIDYCINITVHTITAAASTTTTTTTIPAPPTSTAATTTPTSAVFVLLQDNTQN